MRLVSLRIETLPGIERPWSIDGFAPGVSVVVGPNASGKSSLVRAVRALLTPEAIPGGAVHVEARFDEDGVTWRASRLGASVRWERDGRATEPPARPAAGADGGFFLGLEELLRFTASDRDLAARLTTELAGGIDVPKARRELGSVGPRFGKAQADADREARSRKAEAQRARDALRHDEARLEDLRRRAAEAGRHAADADAVRTAQDLLAAREELASVERHASAAFPAGMDRLHDALVAAIDTATKDVERAVAQQRAAEAALATAEAEARATGLDPDRPSYEDVTAWGAAAQEWAATERDARDAGDDAAEAQARLVELLATSGQDQDDAAADAAAGRLSPARLDELEEFADEREEAERDLRALDRERERLGPRPEPADDPDLLQRGIRLLSAWLAAPDPRRVVRARLARLASYAALAGSGVAAVLASSDPPAGATTIGLGGAAAALIAALALDASARHRGRRRHELARAYVEIGAPPPDAWREGPVRERLLELARRRAAADLAARRAVEHDARSRALADAAEDRSAQRDRAAERLRRGLAALHLDVAWADRPALRRLRRLDEILRARAELAGARARRDERARRSERLRGWLEAHMGGHDVAPGVTATQPTEALGERLRRLGERVRRRDAASVDAASARRDVRRAEDELARLEDRRASLLVEAGVCTDVEEVRARPDAALQELARRAERLPTWRDLAERRERLTTRVEDLGARLDGHADLLDRVDAGDRAALESEARRAADAVLERDRSRDEASRIEQRLETARAARPVQAARAEARRARDALEAAHERALDAAAEAVVFDHVEERHRTVRRPALLSRAERWFARFTHHAFELAFEPSGDEAGAIRARDVAAERVRELDELSTGTKAQLLLALRLAHALEAERGGPVLPLFLDEALTTSDPERFAAVVDALSRLVREEGRQIVYLTARRDDAALWRRLAERTGAEPPHVLDLAAQRSREAAAGGPTRTR